MIATGTARHAVIDVRWISEGLFILVLERNGLEFDVGDCVALHEADGKSRPYSIASGTGENELRFVIRQMEGGDVSTWLACRQPGDEIEVGPSFGWFRPGQGIGGAPFVLVATGTGISPFLSYRRSFPDVPPLALLYGVRREADAAGIDELQGWTELRLAVSREQTTHHHGRVTGLLDDLPANASIHYYLCGIESMIADCTHALVARGMDLSRIHREVFFHG